MKVGKIMVSPSLRSTVSHCFVQSRRPTTRGQVLTQSLRTVSSGTHTTFTKPGGTFSSSSSSIRYPKHAISSEVDQQLSPFPKINKCHFHASASVEFPVRRRKRSTGSGLINTGSGVNGNESSKSRSVEEPSASSSANNDVSDENETESYDSSTTISTMQHTPVQDIQQFRWAAHELLEKLEKALSPMKSKNDIFIVTRDNGDIGETLKLELGPSIGHYLIEISEEECVMQYSSPITGQILYFLSDATNEWLAIDDGHLFEGIFVRDLIRQCQGLPNL